MHAKRAGAAVTMRFWRWWREWTVRQRTALGNASTQRKSPPGYSARLETSGRSTQYTLHHQSTTKDFNAK